MFTDNEVRILFADQDFPFKFTAQPSQSSCNTPPTLFFMDAYEWRDQTESDVRRAVFLYVIPLNETPTSIRLVIFLRLRYPFMSGTWKSLVFARLCACNKFVHCSASLVWVELETGSCNINSTKDILTVPNLCLLSDFFYVGACLLTTCWLNGRWI